MPYIGSEPAGSPHRGADAHVLPCCGAEPFIGAGSDNDLGTGIQSFLRHCITDTGAAAHDHDSLVFKHSVFRLHEF